MGTCVQYVLCFINLLLVGAIPKSPHSNATFGVENIRLRRQAGYVYDRPSLSFNLPSQSTVGSTSTQATTVDRTSAQHMYYAYPAPASGSTGNVGYSNTAGATSTATSGATGYNYDAATQNTATGTTSATGGGSVSNGYSNSGTTRTASSISSGGSTGYNYGGGTQNTASISNDGSTSVVSGPKGYDYQSQNTGLQTITNTGSTGYSATSSGSNFGVSTGVSTKAPEYLPPTNSGVNMGVSASSNTQTSSGTPNVMPSDIYLPPAVSVSTPEVTPTVSVTQTGGNAVPQVNGLTQTYGAPINNPSSSYLTPRSGPQTSNVQNTQSQVKTTSTGNVQSLPTQEYLPPVISSGTSGQGSFTPATKYLPPVF